MSGRKSDTTDAGLDRRGFLRATGVGAVAGVGAVVLGGAERADAKAPEPETKGRYRETDHVRQVYDLSRF